MAVVNVLACDVCGEQPAGPWRLKEGSDPEYRVDLCDACGKPLRALRKKGKKVEDDKPLGRPSVIHKSIDYNTVKAPRKP